MNALTTQIVTLYEQESFTPEMIAESLDADLVAVKTALLQSSMEYRKKLRKEEETFGDSEFDQARRVMSDLLYDENSSVRLKASKYIIDEVRGRNDMETKLNSLANAPQINVLVISETLEKARKSLARSREKLVEAEAV